MGLSLRRAIPTYPHIERYYEHKQQLIELDVNDQLPHQGKSDNSVHVPTAEQGDYRRYRPRSGEALRPHG